MKKDLFFPFKHRTESQQSSILVPHFSTTVDAVFSPCSLLFTRTMSSAVPPSWPPPTSSTQDFRGNTELGVTCCFVDRFTPFFYLLNLFSDEPLKNMALTTQKTTAPKKTKTDDFREKKSLLFQQIKTEQTELDALRETNAERERRVKILKNLEEEARVLKKFLGDFTLGLADLINKYQEDAAEISPRLQSNENKAMLDEFTNMKRDASAGLNSKLANDLCAKKPKKDHTIYTFI